jgi:imidazolonepropionase-like amidohydrolase
VPRAAALAAVTTTPARMLGLEERVGSLAKGKDANVLVLSGEPLSSGTWVEEVILEGEHVYSKSEDERLEKLTGDSKDGGR